MQWIKVNGFSVQLNLFLKILKKDINSTQKSFIYLGTPLEEASSTDIFFFKPKAPVVKAVAANPAFVTVPDFDIQYPFGLKNTPLKKRRYKTMVQAQPCNYSW